MIKTGILAAVFSLILVGCGKSKAQQEAETAQIEKHKLEVRKKLEEDEKQFEQRLAVIAKDNQLPPVATLQLAGVSGEAEQRAAQAVEIKKFQDKLLLRLKDPSSAQFRNVKLNHFGDALCGEVNAKNGFGGYNGFKGFVVTNTGAYVESDKKDDLEGLIYQGTAEQQGCNR